MTTGTKVEDTIQSLLQNFDNIVRSKNILPGYATQLGVDHSTTNWLLNLEVSENPIPEGKWKNVDTKIGTSEKVMLETAQKMSLSQAIKKITQMLEEGIFDKLNTCRTIFLEETNAKVESLKFICIRYSNGRLDYCVRTVLCNHVRYGFDYGWFQKKRA